MTMRRGFTLVELLVVMAIMGMMGLAATGGYQAMVQAMESRGVLQNVNALVQAAHQRAQIDRKPVMVYFWNETLRPQTEDKFEVVVGRAVAVRSWGRITRVEQGTYLVDEFNDLSQTFRTNMTGSASSSTMALYAFDNLSSGATRRYSEVYSEVVKRDTDSPQLSNGQIVNIPAYAYVLRNGNNLGWRQGRPYGLEFMQLELPDGFIFGTEWNQKSNPKEIYSIVFRPDQDCTDQVEVSILRSKGDALEPEPVGRSKCPRVEGGGI